LVLRPQFFKSLRLSKAKTNDYETALAKTKTSKNGLKTKTGLKDYITGLYLTFQGTGHFWYGNNLTPIWLQRVNLLFSDSY